jgi:stage V sporulation protein AD
MAKMLPFVLVSDFGSWGGYFVKRMQAGELKRVLAVGTGALLSASTPLQKLSIPAIAHAVCLEVV